MKSQMSVMLYPSHETCDWTGCNEVHIPFDFAQIALLKQILQKDKNETAKIILKNIPKTKARKGVDFGRFKCSYCNNEYIAVSMEWKELAYLRKIVGYQERSPAIDELLVLLYEPLINRDNLDDFICDRYEDAICPGLVERYLGHHRNAHVIYHGDKPPRFKHEHEEHTNYDRAGEMMSFMEDCLLDNQFMTNHNVDDVKELTRKFYGNGERFDSIWDNYTMKSY